MPNQENKSDIFVNSDDVGNFIFRSCITLRITAALASCDFREFCLQRTKTWVISMAEGCYWIGSVGGCPYNGLGQSELWWRKIY